MSKRIKFFLGHLSISLFIATLITILVLLVWYPFPLSKAVGVTQIFLMVLIIDVIIGPLLSLVVYKEKKRTLLFDLSAIILCQVLALSFGIYSLSQGRPTWIVFHTDRFELVRNNETIIQENGSILPEYQNPFWFGVKYAAVQQANNFQQKNDDVFMEALGGISLSQMPERYVDLSKVIVKIKQNTKNLKELSKYNNEQKVAAIIAKYPQAKGFLPLKASIEDMTVLVDHNGEVVKIVDLRPW